MVRVALALAAAVVLECAVGLGGCASADNVESGMESNSSGFVVDVDTSAPFDEVAAVGALVVADRALGTGAGAEAGGDVGAAGGASPAPAASALAGRLDDINDNVFLDALAYTGYDLAKHRNDGLMWDYVAWTDKEWRGWLSGITYGGDCSGYETDDAGLPDIAAFRRGGLVCASYVTYVYFNYLPNVLGIDVSALSEPDLPTGADSWYRAALDWVDAGQSRLVDFDVDESNNWLTFQPAEDIPIGSLVFFTDAKDPTDYASHVAIYAGETAGYHWLTHVGNVNGPEFCAVERMHFGEDPQWPIAVITRPACVG